MTAQVTAYSFDDFVLNLVQQTLTFRDHRLPLTSKAFQTLLLLLRSQGKVVEKEQFLKEIWPDTFVQESTLSQNIRTLRKTLGAYSPDKEFIATIPRRGYQFTQDVTEVSSMGDR